MQHKYRASTVMFRSGSGSSAASNFAVVYYYLFAGIALSVAVFLFLPRLTG